MVRYLDIGTKVLS